MDGLTKVIKLLGNKVLEKACFETIKVQNGKLLNLKYHQQRVDYTREFLGFNERLELKEDSFDLPQLGEFRLRVDYYEDIKSSTCKALTCRTFKEFKIVESDISYGYKYSNREKLDYLKVDEKEIIIVKDGLLTDTTIANIALHVNGIWFTPRVPLLKGTTRARLIDEGFLRCEDLSIKDLEIAQKFAIMNALNDFIVVKAKIELGFNSTIQK